MKIVPEIALAATGSTPLPPEPLVRRLDLALTGGTLEPENYQLICEALNRAAPPNYSDSNWQRDRVRLAIYPSSRAPESFHPPADFASSPRTPWPEILFQRILLRNLPPPFPRPGKLRRGHRHPDPQHAAESPPLQFRGLRRASPSRASTARWYLHFQIRRQ